MGTEQIRVAEVVRKLRAAGIKGVAQRGVRALYRRLDVPSIDFSIRPEDLADSTRLPRRAEFTSSTSNEIPRIGVVCAPPGPGSGGHTTLFRMVQGLEDRGYSCTLLLYDAHQGEMTRREAVIRQSWPWLSANVANVDDGLGDVDAVIASSWESAHVVASRPDGPAARLYFVQDFEPYFYPHGSLYTYAEDSYRFGFRTIALGNMVASLVRDEGVTVDVAPFGCDTETYSLRNREQRSGVVFYAKPGNDRRGYMLGKATLHLFHRMHPEVDIHIYGDPVADWEIPVVRHGRLTPTQLNDLYNRTIGGLALSFTNISLVAEEMLAAGAIPVINDSTLARADLENPEAVWSVPTPGGLAEGLARIVEQASDPTHPVEAARHVRQGWGPAQQIVADVVFDELRRLNNAPLAPTSLLQREGGSIS